MANSNGPSTLPCGTPWRVETDCLASMVLVPVSNKRSQPAEDATTDAEITRDMICAWSIV